MFLRGFAAGCAAEMPPLFCTRSPAAQVSTQYMISPWLAINFSWLIASGRMLPALDRAGV